MPVIVHDYFKRGADSLGYFYSAAGVGAVLGVILVSAFSKKINNLFFILGGNFLFAISIILFSYTTNVFFALFFLFLSGLGLISQFAMVNTSIQHTVDDHVRGRVMSIYTLMFLGMSPFGSFQIGFVAEHFGPQFSIRFGAFFMLIAGFLLFLYRHKINLKNRASF